MTYYELLGISSKATPKEIKKAFIKLCLELHPDKHEQFLAEHPNITPEESRQIKQENEARLKLISTAYDVLQDAAQREAYDLEMRLSTKSRAASSSSTSSEDVIDPISKIKIALANDYLDSYTPILQQYSHEHLEKLYRILTEEKFRKYDPLAMKDKFLFLEVLCVDHHNKPDLLLTIFAQDGFVNPFYEKGIQYLLTPANALLWVQMLQEHPFQSPDVATQFASILIRCDTFLNEHASEKVRITDTNFKNLLKQIHRCSQLRISLNQLCLHLGFKIINEDIDTLCDVLTKRAVLNEDNSGDAAYDEIMRRAMCTHQNNLKLDRMNREHLEYWMEQYNPVYCQGAVVKLEGNRFTIPKRVYEMMLVDKSKYKTLDQYLSALDKIRRSTSFWDKTFSFVFFGKTNRAELDLYQTPKLNGYKVGK